MTQQKNLIEPEAWLIAIARERVTESKRAFFMDCLRQLPRYGIVGFNRGYLAQLAENRGQVSKMERLCNVAVKGGILGQFIRNGKMVYSVA